jgi:peptide-methionine (S)-S-oxide reductase
MRIGVVAISAMAALALAVSARRCGMAEPAGNHTQHGKEQRKVKTAAFGAGCFWGVQAAFDEVKGVVATEVGYMGGHTKDPTYREVCTDRTGHAEALQVSYDPAVVSYAQLLDLFWRIHDPTTLNRQGPDVGSQYRSVIFFHSLEQEAAARASLAKIEKSGKWKRPIVTEIVPASEFYRGEEYHQKYFRKHNIPSCHIAR